MLLDVYGWLPDLVETTLDNLETLWLQWMHGRRGEGWQLRALRALEERIEAHQDAVVLAQEEALPFLDATLGTGFWAADLAATRTCLGSGAPWAMALLWERFEGSSPEDRAGMIQGLRLGAIKPAQARLQELARSDDQPLAAAAATALCSHGQFADALRVQDWRAHEDAAVRGSAWTMSAQGVGALTPAEVERGLKDEEETVRALVCETALGLGVDIKAKLRALAGSDPVAQRWFAMISEADDLPLWEGVLEDESLGAERFEALASYGQPALVPKLIERLEGAHGAAAGAAFMRITGLDVRGEAEDEEGERLCDPALAEDAWSQVGPGQAKRWVLGVEVDAEGAVEQVDLRGRFEHQIRALSRREAPEDARQALERYPAW